MNIYLKQKLYIISFIGTLNLILCITSIIYIKYWYVFIIFLSMPAILNSFYAILLFLYTNCLLSNNTNYDIDTYISKSLLIIVPCYNETINELCSTFESIYEQKNINLNKKLLVVICDGKIKNPDSVTTTDRLLTDYIFFNKIQNNYNLNCAYKTWDNKWNNLTIYTGIKNNIKFMLIIKDYNYGKRDSLTLIRRIAYGYNNINFSTDNLEFISYDLDKIINDEFNNIFDNISNNKIDYIYGTDADTILDEYCISNLMIDMNNNIDENIVASVGFVDVNIKKWYNPLILYQFVEYIYAQNLRRRFQSEFTKKVNCLSGCNQLIKICKETCGKEILEIFNKKPHDGSNIFDMIISTASEDRNHVTLMFQLFPYIKTIQTINSIVYTNVPTNINKFLIQSKRWTRGAIFNDILIIRNNNHNIIERIQSFINLFTNIINIFIIFATGLFIYAIIHNSSMLMLYLSIPIFVLLLHMLIIPLNYYKMSSKTKYYYLGILVYIILGPILSLMQYFYTSYNIDNFNWNKKEIKDKREINHKIINIDNTLDLLNSTPKFESNTLDLLNSTPKFESNTIIEINL